MAKRKRRRKRKVKATTPAPESNGSNGNGAEHEEDAPPKRKRRVSIELAQAIMCIHERKKISFHVDYEEVSTRFGVAHNTLKSAYSLWRKGLIDLGPVEQSPSDRALDLRMQHAKTLELVNRHLSLVLVHYEGAINTAERKVNPPQGRGKPAVSTGKLTHRSELTFLSRELFKMLSLRRYSEDGYNSYLAELTPAKMPEKSINPDNPVPVDVQTKIIRVSNEQRALEALRAPDEPEPPAS